MRRGSDSSENVVPQNSHNPTPLLKRVVADAEMPEWVQGC
jgi:hypothetical protein